QISSQVDIETDAGGLIPSESIGYGSAPLADWIGEQETANNLLNNGLSLLNNEVEAARNGKATIAAEMEAMRDATSGKAGQSEFNVLKAEMETARNGKTNLNAELVSMRLATTTVNNGLAEKVSVTSFNDVQASVNTLNTARLADSLGGSVGENPAGFTSTLVGSPATVADLPIA
ncbi:hypothetical protein, partial [Kitasatospora cinereorecta]